MVKRIAHRSASSRYEKAASSGGRVGTLQSSGHNLIPLSGDAHPKPNVKALAIRTHSEADGATNATSTIAKCAPTHYASIHSLWIVSAIRGFVGVGFWNRVTPLQHVSGHVQQAVGADAIRICAHRRGFVRASFPAITPLRTPFIPPRPDTPARPSCPLLPLGLARKPIRLAACLGQPIAVIYGVVPGDPNHRMLVFAFR
jgi:hypothetical protein